MNTKEVGELRRRMRRDRSNMTTIYGCYVNSQKEIVSLFQQSTGMMSENEAEKYFAVLKRTLSGTLGKNLVDISFKTSQVADSDEHRFLMALRDCKLNDENLRRQLFEKIIENVTYEEGFAVLAGCDVYDVPFKSKDDDAQAEASDQTYTYICCAVCPVKPAKPHLQYEPEEKQFRDTGSHNILCAPEEGFLFPAFDDRASNIYNALFYTHSPKEGHESLIEALFRVRPPKPAYEQMKSFEGLLASSLEDNCSMEVVQAVHDDLRQSMEMHKESKVAEPLLISKEQVKASLTTCGVAEEKIAKFSVNFDETFGNEALLHPANLVDTKHFRIDTPAVSIQVDPARSDLVETRMLGGVPYIVICADETVEVNGVPIRISEE